jgi:hypothetical protein
MPVIFHSRWRLRIPLALALLALIVSLVFTLIYRGFTQAAGEPPRSAQ